MSNKNSKKVVVGMSGGVDSSVAAYLLLEQGYQVCGLFMKNWEEDDNELYCAAAIDLADTQDVCDKLNIELHTVNFSAEYWSQVFTIFLAEYRAGRTPNPDILCNKEIKFKAFLEFALKDLKADYIATGHYVRHQSNNGQHFLLRGIDENKDQSYFLYTIGQQQLDNCLFPIGGLKKSEVRDIAKKLNLVNAQKKDSTGICFVGERKFRDFISQYLSSQIGSIMTIDGKYIGQHQGLMYHTLGQRKGIGIGGVKGEGESPWYVVDKDIKNNILLVAQNPLHPRLMSKGLIAQKLHWVNSPPTKAPYRCVLKIRYRQKDIRAEIIVGQDQSIVRFEHPVSSVTPGQSVVFYQNEFCLGGGIIEKRL
ncbi:tRNA 2-thiouridine(34) synthase MnmA [Candidatus Williamhamiltonella defendens]|uniref:tRNA 2-thiouridine(34) synthase MnmA n=1 Tax=Candidatus Williamhamiltonella defendens TaxID=138072 RepID=UPI00130E0DF4|nr:tRNA 2-thiouridine(34) synthase MnmA [Candidatus Hamiltonella defensa]